MENNREVQEESLTEYQRMFPGYENHVYRSPFSNELSAPDKLPGAPCHSPLE